MRGIRGLGWFVVAAVLVGAGLFGLIVLRRSGLAVRYTPVSEAEFDRLSSEPFRSRDDSLYFAGMARRAGLDRGDPSPEAVAERAMRWVMDQVPVTGFGVTRVGATTRDQLEFALAGGGLQCHQMASIVNRLLRSMGLRSRVLTLMSDLGVETVRTPPAVHALVEVEVDGHWRVFDPTFHLTFARDGEPVGARAIQSAVREGEVDRVEPVFHGEVRYPARLETYPVRWDEHFNLVFVGRRHRPETWAKLPPFRYWFGGQLLYVSDEATRGVSDFNTLYLLTTVLLPLGGAAAGLMGVRAWRGAAGRVRTRPSRLWRRRDERIPQRRG